MLDKAKAHFLVHMPFFVRRFGPLLGPDTERYESFNSTFRECSVLSNRQAPSLDILTQFVDFDIAKHICSGGWWYDKERGVHRQGGSQVVAAATHNDFIQRLTGFKQTVSKAPGTFDISPN